MYIWWERKRWVEVSVIIQKKRPRLVAEKGRKNRRYPRVHAGHVAGMNEGFTGGRETLVDVFLEDDVEPSDRIGLEDVDPVGERDRVV
jgi:hypothetical protein